MRYKYNVLLAAVLAFTISACATTHPTGPISLKQATSPALSVETNQRDLIVAVSPVRKSIQILGSSAIILGAGIDAMINEKYRQPILDALQGYRPGDVFIQRLNDQLRKTMPNLVNVAPLGSTAGFQTIKEAEEARLKSLADKKYDRLIDLHITYGIFGYEGILVSKIEGKVVALPDQHVLWRGSILASSEPVLATDKLKDPSKGFTIEPSSPHFTVDEQAVARWTQNHGQYLKEQFEKSIDYAIAGLMTDLGLAESAAGEFCLAKNLMNRKKFNEADEHFKKALQLDPQFTDAMNARAVNLAHNKQIDDAITLEKQVVQQFPNYGPAYYNLAFWYATAKNDVATAKGYYQKALNLGMPPEKKIEKILS